MTAASSDMTREKEFRTMTKKGTMFGVRAGTVCGLGAIAGIVIVGDTACGPRQPLPELDAMGHTACEGLLQDLRTYYIRLKENAPENINKAFASYVQDHWATRCSVAPPPPSHQSMQVLGIYLLLPERLESPRPVLIAYTDPKPDDLKGHLWRQIIVLRGKELVHLKDRSWRVEMMVGKGNMEGRKPDLYFRR